ncbi:hypothetical protein A3860_17765 [Niastella vici]|uniref:Carbohydrate-binding protein SusD n=1 Tax=Niastella vici TaxID=1703345 RepID=A0A1V9G4N3_9BACT|nr:RagB/SusD family nutrient uptake outer membrane protein [Niastella vici]OQP65512.1 hypothetical protein A3860_17765 [Niastella vici]
MIRNRFSIFLLCFLLCSACKKSSQVEEPILNISLTDHFANDSTAQATLAGVYTNIMSRPKCFLNGGVTLFAGLSADELWTSNYEANSYEDEFFDNDIGTGNSINSENLWQTAFRHINQFNYCIEGVKQSGNVSPELKRRITGEAKFMRALCFYYLTNLYGKVPLLISGDYEQIRNLPLSEMDKVYDQIIKDLKAADSLLNNDVLNIYPSRMPCQALLAQVYLHRNEWKKAADASSTVIDSGKYKLETDLNQVFLSQSKETIFQLVPVPGSIQTVEGNIFIPSSKTDKPSYPLHYSIRDGFEPGDQRKDNWTKPQLYYGFTYHFPYKYKSRSASQPKENNIVLRLAQQYLIRAEARMKMGDLAGCASDLNTIRNRAGLPSLPLSYTEQQLMNAIEQENKVEFFAEWGHRWIDLKRWGKIVEVLAPLKGGFDARAQLYPIPLWY